MSNIRVTVLSVVGVFLLSTSLGSMIPRRSSGGKFILGDLSPRLLNGHEPKAPPIHLQEDLSINFGMGRACTVDGIEGQDTKILLGERQARLPVAIVTDDREWYPFGISGEEFGLPQNSRVAVEYWGRESIKVAPGAKTILTRLNATRLLKSWTNQREAYVKNKLRHHGGKKRKGGTSHRKGGKRASRGLKRVAEALLSCQTWGKSV